MFYFKNEATRKEKIKAILFDVCASNEFSPQELFKRSRETKYTMARHEAMYRMRAEIHGLTLSEIGEVFNTDHSNVINGIKRHQESLKTRINQPS